MPSFELTVVDEWVHCTSVTSPADLLDCSRSPSRMVVSYGGWGQRQSQYSQIGPAGGRYIPTWWLEDNEIFHAGIEVYHLPEAYFFPDLGVLVTPDGKVMKRSFDEAKYFLKDIANLPMTDVSSGRPIMTLPDEMPHFQGVAVTFPWGALTNYGHFLVDCLSGIAGIQTVGALAEYQFLFPELKAWHLRHLTLMNVAPIQQVPHAVVHLTDVIFANTLDHFLHVSTDIMARVAKTERTSLNVCAESAKSHRIYISRRKILGRSFSGELAVEKALRRLGFQIVAPETLSVDEQIVLFAHAEAVVGFSGAAFANVIYCPPGAKIVEIQTAHMQGFWIRNLALFANCSYHAFFCGDLTAAPPQWNTKEFCTYLRTVLDEGERLSVTPSRASALSTLWRWLSRRRVRNAA